MKNLIKILCVLMLILAFGQDLYSQNRRNVFVNSQEITQGELYVLDVLLGEIPAGKYYLLENGYFGVEGYYPFANLFVLYERLRGYAASNNPSYRSEYYYQNGNNDGVHWKEGNTSGYFNWNRGTSISSDGETSVISVDGKVLNLPPY